LKLFSRLATREQDVPTPLIKVAIAKWLRRIHEQGTGEMEGGVDSIARLARYYPVAVEALREIAADYRYHMDAVNAARHLHALGYAQEAHARLLAIVAWGWQDLEIEGAKALYQLGFKEEGWQRLLLLDGRVRHATTTEELMHLPELVTALHECDGQPEARSLLDEIASRDCINDLLMGAIAATYADIGAPDAVQPFVRGWWERNDDFDDEEPVSAQALTEEFIAATTALDIDELMSLPGGIDDAGQPRGELLEVWQRLPTLMSDTDRAGEIARNQYLDLNVRIQALNYLEMHDAQRHREVALELLDDEAVTVEHKHRLAARLSSEGLGQIVGDTLERFVSDSTFVRVEEAKLLATVGRHSHCIRYLRQVVRTAACTESYPVVSRALAEMGESQVAMSCLRRAIPNHSVPAKVFQGVAAELLLTEHADEVNRLLWALLADPSQPADRRLAICVLLDEQQLLPELRKRLRGHVRQIGLGRRVAAFISEEALELLADMDSDGNAGVLLAPSTEDDEIHAAVDELHAALPRETSPEAGQRLADIDQRGAHGIDPALEPELLDIANDARVTLRNRFGAIIRLTVVGDPAQAQRIVLQLLQTQREHPGIPPDLVPNFALYLIDAKQPDRALDLYETTLKRPDLDVGHAVRLAGSLATQGFSVQARQHARAFMKTALAMCVPEEGSSLALFDCACLLFKLGDRLEARALLETVATSAERPLWQRVYACHALARVGALSTGRSLLRTLLKHPDFPEDARIPVLSHCVALRLDDLVRIELLKFTRSEGASHRFSGNMFVLLQRLGYGCAVHPQALIDVEMSMRLQLLKQMCALQMWNDAHALVRQVLCDPDASHSDRVACLKELRSSPLEQFAADQAYVALRADASPSGRIEIARLFALLNHVDVSRRILLALRDVHLMDTDRFELASALMAVGCDESAFEQLQQVERQASGEQLNASCAELRLNWARGS
jgi:hypothetical protein